MDGCEQDLTRAIKCLVDRDMKKFIALQEIMEATKLPIPGQDTMINIHKIARKAIYDK